MSSTAQAAATIGVSKNTLLRWIAQGLIPDVPRDWRGWRLWSRQDINGAVAFKQAYHSKPIPRVRRQAARTNFVGSAGQCMRDLAEAWKSRRRARA